MPNLSPLISRISGPAAQAWEVGNVAFERIRQGHDIIHLGVGDPDLDTPKPIRQALVDALESGKTHYSPLAGEPALRAAIAESAAKIYGGQVNAANVVVTSGAQGALFAVFLLIASAGDEVIVLEPAYATYPASVTAGGATMVTVKLAEQDGYQLDIPQITAAITPRTRAILVNSPGNPSGTVFEQNDLDTLAGICAERGIWLVSDEVYWSLCYDRDHSSPYKRQDTRQNVIVLNSLSKSHAMTGWRLGWAIAPDAIVEQLINLAQTQHFGINQFVQEAALSAVRDDVTTHEIRRIFQLRRDALMQELRKSNVLSFSEPEGGMFLLIDVSRTGLDGKAFAEKLLDLEQVAVVPGFGFGAGMSDCIRVGFLTDPERLKEAGRRIVRFANEVKNV
ncbi:aminotransferase class I/II-fold pyridoxal phosphate-dependent enzyme [Paracoccus sp. 11-3]|uniref:Aminotransferase n=1 Tax=Paracoccus amoyensis TaxID=2760093 RepID=A0A926J7P8_9RHOB|nr:aminotransferase class I/II-fold pyridoxal phosphate-dependent enzyme [Paracoccus amoyensis]MBC9248557.1 aminotransferase class I/II-fold pyridoxal phosphate-dependent enzyme [Paracoccus amoyensis]